MTERNEERILIQKAIEGDRDSLEALLLSCKGKAYSIACRYMKNEDDAMDALQESYIKIFRNLSRFNFESRFDTWVYRIVMNTCNDLYRKNKKNANIISLSNSYDEEETAGAEFAVADTGAGPEQLYERKEESRYLIECVNRLNDEHRQVIILRDMKGFSYEEISEILDCSLGTVKSRISRARLRLREIYLEGKNKENKK